MLARGNTTMLITNTGSPKSNFLLAIICCWHRRWATNAIRETWLPEIHGKFDYKFFYGRGGNAEFVDEQVLDCDDAYRGLACKVWRISQYALTHGYDHVFKIDDDGYLVPQRLRTAVPVEDYVGRVCAPGDKYHGLAYARGGTGYWLSEKALRVLAAAPQPNPDDPKEYAEDSWVAHTLAKAGIVATNDDRYRCADGSGPGRKVNSRTGKSWQADVPKQYNKFITTCEFLGPEMVEAHHEWVKSCEELSALMSKLVLK